MSMQANSTVSWSRFTGRGGAPSLVRRAAAFARGVFGSSGTGALCEGLEPRQLLSFQTGPTLDWSGGSEGPTDGMAAFADLREGQIGRVRWAGGTVPAVAGQYVLGVKEGPGGFTAERALSVAQGFGAALGIDVRDARVIPGNRHVVFTTSRELTTAQVRSATARVEGLHWVEPNMVYEPSRVPNDPQFNQQWWLQNSGQTIPGFGRGTPGADIKITGAWDTTIGSRSVVIAVIDSGIDFNHPDMAANIYRNPGEIAGNNVDDDGNGFVDDVSGWDFGDLDNNPQDDSLPGWFGHGTSAAGMIGAVSNNGDGVAAVNWDVSILPLKISLNQFFDEFDFAISTTSTAAIVGAYDYITLMAQRGVNIVAVNNSYRAVADIFFEDIEEGDLAVQRSAIQRVIDAGVTFVASAGNDADDNDEGGAAYPASFNLPGLISVAATDPNDAMAGFSNFGARTVDLGAPGVATWTIAAGGGYRNFGGTSAAGPVVAGAVGLLKAVKPSASAAEIRNVLINTVDPLPALQGRTVSGGRLNVTRALEAIGIAGPVVRAINPGPITGQVDATENPAGPLDTIRVTFSKPVNVANVSVANFRLIGAGADDQFDTIDDLSVPVSAVAAAPGDPNTLIATLDLTAPVFSGRRLPLDFYRLTLRHNLAPNQSIKDGDGNFLSGNSVSGRDFVHDFRVVSVTGDFESNDTLGTATPVTFAADTTARFSGVTLGNGLAANLDVDIYRLELARGGQITADIFAKRRASPSTLDSYLRLFNASGTEIAANDQFFGSDSYLSYFVSTGGTYYVAVSGFGNSGYDPNTPSSGSTQSTGVYDLTLSVTLIADDRVTASATIPSGGVRIPVDSNGVATRGTTTATVEISDSRQILDVNARVNLTHEFNADLRIALRAPTGREVVLSNQRGGNGRNFTSTLFDDEAVTPIASGAAPFTGTFRPDEALSGFDGLSALGTWTLIVEDLSTLNTGVLLSFDLEITLENDIFGPFESNDILSDAEALTGVNVSGTASVSAFIGDGGFGLQDRDLFRFTAGAGSSLTARVTSGRLGTTGSSIVAGSDSLNAAVRLFDAVGRELRSSNPDGTKNALIENFVFTEAGTYYLGVSESANARYGATDPNSGSVSSSTGNYVLNVTLAAGVSDPALTLSGANVTAGFSTGATFASGTAGLRFGGTEFLSLATSLTGANAFFGALAAGSTFRNSTGDGGVELPFSLVDQSDSVNNRASARAAFITPSGQLRIERTIAFGRTDDFIAMDVFLTNNGSAGIGGVQWVEAFNPQQGLNLAPANASTFNDLSGYVSGTPRLATARYNTNAFPGGLTIGLGAAASQAHAPIANIIPASLAVRDPAQVREQAINDPDGAGSDSLLALSFNVGDIPAGATRQLRYFVFFGNSAATVSDRYAALNANTAGGHLSADPASPAVESFTFPGEVAPVTVNLPLLPYRVYYPEGFANSQTYTFVPMLNPHDQTTRVSVIARYEADPARPFQQRDQIISDFTLEAGQRGGITITTPELFAANQQLVAKDIPYAIEIRSSLPVSATFSHYDLFLLAGGRAAIGQSFTTRTSDTWSFGEVVKGGGVSDFLLFMNTTGETVKVTTTFYRRSAGGESVGAPIEVTQELGAYRRGGFNVNQDFGSLIPAGTYGVVVRTSVPIIATLSHYNAGQGDSGASAFGYLGAPGTGFTGGVSPEGQVGLNSETERLAILNTNSTSANVTLSFVFANGNSYRNTLTVPARAQRTVSVESLPNFPLGQPYAVQYTSSAPVSVSQPTLAFGNGLANSFADRAYTLWSFGEGYRGPNNVSNVVEYLRIYNPNPEPMLAEITIRFDNDQGSETFRPTIPGRSVQEIDVHQYVTGPRRAIEVFYGLTVKTPQPVVAYFGHFDPFFPGAFGTMGTPFGLSAPISG